MNILYTYPVLLTNYHSVDAYIQLRVTTAVVEIVRVSVADGTQV